MAPNPNPPVASIIVPTRMRPDYLKVALASIAPQKITAGAELIVVDDGGPSEQNRRLAARFGARYESHPGPLGLNVARNTGVERSTGELIVFVDDDVEVCEGWLTAMLTAARDYPDVEVFTGPILPRLEGDPPHSCGREGPPITSLDLGSADTPTRFAWGANMAIRRRALKRIGPFDISLQHGGDEQEWQERLAAEHAHQERLATPAHTHQPGHPAGATPGQPASQAGAQTLYVADAALHHRRSAADARLLPLCRASRARGKAARRFDAWRHEAPSLGHELRTLAGCLGHVVRRRCPAGLVMVAHSTGRVEEALRAHGNIIPTDRHPIAAPTGKAPTRAPSSPVPAMNTPAPAMKTPAPAMGSPAPAPSSPVPAMNTPAPAPSLPAPAPSLPAPAMGSPTSAMGSPATNGDATDDFLSGESGTVGGLDALLRATLDHGADALQVISGHRRRLNTAARNSPPTRHILVLGIERPQHRALAQDVRKELNRSRHHLDLYVSPPGDRGKFENLNLLLDGHPPHSYDWLLVVDDDIVLPPGFLDHFLFLAERFHLDLAQPAHHRASHAAWRVTRRRSRSVVRETNFVEIGPVTAFARSTFSTLLPFPELRMGWGLDMHWAALAQARGWRCGVIDSVPIRHRAAPAASAYSRGQALAEARAFLEQRPYLSASEAQQTLITHRRW